MASPSLGATPPVSSTVTNSFDLVPDEVILHMMQFLPADQVQKLKSVCKRMKGLVEYTFNNFTEPMKKNYLATLETKKQFLENVYNMYRGVVTDYERRPDFKKEVHQSLMLTLNQKYVEPRRACQREIGILKGLWADQTNGPEAAIALKKAEGERWRAYAQSRSQAPANNA